MTVANISKSPDYDGDEWCTPEDVIEAARAVMGSIDTDPATNQYAQKYIKAKNYWTKESNGLYREWIGNVWLNPPYSSPLIKEFVKKFIESSWGSMDAGLILTNNNTDTGWFHDLANQFPMCLPRGRLSFSIYGKRCQGNRQGQAVFCFGGRDITDRFYKIFRDFTCFPNRL